MAQHANKRAAIQVVTANRLLDGGVVYLTASDTWSEGLQEAAVAENPEEAKALLDKAGAGVETDVIVNPYLFEVRREDALLHPASVRERIRMAGPTVWVDPCKQTGV